MFQRSGEPFTWIILGFYIVCVCVILFKLYIDHRLNKKRQTVNKNEKIIWFISAAFIILFGIFIMIIERGIMNPQDYKYPNNHVATGDGYMIKSAAAWDLLTKLGKVFAKGSEQYKKGEEAIKKLDQASKLRKANKPIPEELRTTGEEIKLLEKISPGIRAHIPTDVLPALPANAPITEWIKRMNGSLIPEGFAKKIESGEVQLVGLKVKSKNGKTGLVRTGETDEPGFIVGNKQYDIDGNFVREVKQQPTPQPQHTEPSGAELNTSKPNDGTPDPTVGVPEIKSPEKAPAEPAPDAKSDSGTFNPANGVPETDRPHSNPKSEELQSLRNAIQTYDSLRQKGLVDPFPEMESLKSQLPFIDKEISRLERKDIWDRLPNEASIVGKRQKGTYLSDLVDDTFAQHSKKIQGYEEKGGPKQSEPNESGDPAVNIWNEILSQRDPADVAGGGSPGAPIDTGTPGPLDVTPFAQKLRERFSAMAQDIGKGARDHFKFLANERRRAKAEFNPAAAVPEIGSAMRATAFRELADPVVKDLKDAQTQALEEINTIRGRLADGDATAVGDLARIKSALETAQNEYAAKISELKRDHPELGFDRLKAPVFTLPSDTSFVQKLKNIKLDANNFDPNSTTITIPLTRDEAIAAQRIVRLNNGTLARELLPPGAEIKKTQAGDFVLELPNAFTDRTDPRHALHGYNEFKDANGHIDVPEFVDRQFERYKQLEIERNLAEIRGDEKAAKQIDAQMKAMADAVESDKSAYTTLQGRFGNIEDNILRPFEIPPQYYGILHPAVQAPYRRYGLPITPDEARYLGRFYSSKALADDGLSVAKSGTGQYYLVPDNIIIGDAGIHGSPKGTGLVNDGRAYWYDHNNSVYVHAEPGAETQKLINAGVYKQVPGKDNVYKVNDTLKDIADYSDPFHTAKMVGGYTAKPFVYIGKGAKNIVANHPGGAAAAAGIGALTGGAALLTNHLANEYYDNPPDDVKAKADKAVKNLEAEPNRRDQFIKAYAKSNNNKPLNEATAQEAMEAYYKSVVAAELAKKTELEHLTTRPLQYMAANAKKAIVPDTGPELPQVKDEKKIGPKRKEVTTRKTSTDPIAKPWSLDKSLENAKAWEAAHFGKAYSDLPISHTLTGAGIGALAGGTTGALRYLFGNTAQLSEEEKKRRTLMRMVLSNAGVGAGLGATMGGIADIRQDLFPPSARS